MQKITRQTGNGGQKKNVGIKTTLKYLSNFWRTLEMPLINCEINLQLNLSEKCVLVGGTAANQVPEFKIAGTLGSLIQCGTLANFGVFSNPLPISWFHEYW